MTQDKFKLALTFISKMSEGKMNFDGIDLSGSVLEALVAHKGSSLKGAIFQECRLVSAALNGCLLKSAIFDSADLQGAMISESDCQLGSFQGANLSRTNFSRSRLLNANLRKANLQGANFTQADLRGADFRGAILIQVEFRGSFYDDNTLFDVGIDPSMLGMKKVNQEKAVATPKAVSSSKSIMYRGVRMDVTEEVVTESNSSPKAGLMYRGVKI